VVKIPPFNHIKYGGDFVELKDKIIEAKNLLGEKAAQIIAEELGIDNWDDKVLKGCCPFHNEKTGSFIWNKKENHFKCFGCGKNFGILDHYQKQGLSYIESVKKLFNNTDVIFEEHELKENNKEDFFKNYKFPIEETNTDRSKVDEYLAKRGISVETLNFAGVKQDSQGNIVFEHINTNGVLLATKYRQSKALKKTDTKMWWQPKASMCPILYGIDKIDITMPLLITEGHLDRLSCIEAGYTNTCSIPIGAQDLSWIEFNWEWLENFDTIILWADNDDAGKKMIKESVVRIGEERCKIVEPDKYIVDSVKEFWKTYNKNIDKTDANNVILACGKQEVLNLINKAKEVPIPDIVKLMDCEEFDINKAEVFPTGLNDLDSHIFGYIGGTLNIWTGRTAGGKSTFILQSCVLEVVNNDSGVFVFSGELTNPQFKSWVLQQFSGRDHIIEWDNGSNKPKTYTVTHDAKRAIEEKTKDLIYMYDSYLVATPSKIISRMEYMRKKYGIKNFVIDNFMCLELDIKKYGDELNAQKSVIIEFLQFAVRYDAVVHLVAHPRKPNGEAAINEYDILGSSNIPNLAHRIFSVRRTTEEEKAKGKPYDGYVSILKDRILGVSKKDVGVFYDPSTRRMFGDKDNKNKKYNWDNGKITYKTNKFGTNGTLISNRMDIEKNNLEKEVYG
jgi:twinkle protein